MSQVIPYSSMQSALGFDPREGCMQLHSPSASDARIQSTIRLEEGRLFMQTRDDRPGSPDMLRLSLVAQDNGWHIEEQIHSGLSVAPDAELALVAIEQNLCATPLPISPRRPASRP